MEEDKKGKKAARRSPSPFRCRAGETSIGEFVNDFWQHTVSTAENSNDDFKHQSLPLARIKKVMKSDPEVQMISSEVTVLFEKACQIFIQELTARSHLVSLSHKRRTLSRPDVAQAISKSDQFDFLIDIVPRDDDGDVVAHAGGSKKRKASAAKKKAALEDEDDDEHEGKRVRGDEGDDEPHGALDGLGGLAHELEPVNEEDLELAIQQLKQEAAQREAGFSNGHGEVDWSTGVGSPFDFGHVDGQPSFFDPNLTGN